MEHAIRHTIKVDPETQRLLRLIAAHTDDKQYAVLARLVRDEWQRVQSHNHSRKDDGGPRAPQKEPPMPITVTDLLQPADETFPTLEAAMTALMARYPAAVFSDVEWTEPTIWVWPSNTASMHADPAQAVAWLRRTPAPGRDQGAGA